MYSYVNIYAYSISCIIRVCFCNIGSKYVYKYASRLVCVRELIIHPHIHVGECICVIFTILIRINSVCTLLLCAIIVSEWCVASSPPCYINIWERTEALYRSSINLSLYKIHKYLLTSM